MTEEFKARCENEWVMEDPPELATILSMTLRNIKADLAQCKGDMSREDYITCLEYALNDFIPSHIWLKASTKSRLGSHTI